MSLTHTSATDTRSQQVSSMARELPESNTSGNSFSPGLEQNCKLLGPNIYIYIFWTKTGSVPQAPPWRTLCGCRR